jgi:Flp pilus assembly protein TadD
MKIESTSKRTGLAVAAINAARADLAEELIRAELEENPSSGDAHRILGVCLRRRKRLKEALGEGRESVRLAPRSPLCHLDLGRTLLLSHRRPEAERAVHTSLELNPRQPDALATLSRMLADRGELEAAEEAARNGLEIDPHHVQCLSRLALVLLVSHRLPEAHRVFRGALAESPEQAGVHNDLGLALLHRGAYGEARTEFEEALRLDPQLTAAQMNLELVRPFGINAVRPAPYGLRFQLVWSRSTQRRRLAILATLSVLGFLWPVFFGVLAFPLARELQLHLPKAVLPPGLRPTIFLWTWLAVLIAGAVICALQTGYPAASGAHQTAVGTLGSTATPIELNFNAALCQLLMGVTLCGSFQPLFVTRGQARVIAAGVSAVAACAAVAASITGGLGEALAALLLVTGCAGLGPRIVSRAERLQWDEPADWPDPGPAMHEAAD